MDKESTVTQSRHSGQRSDDWRSNPFVPINPLARATIALYFIFWRILPAILVFFVQTNVNIGLATAIVTLTICTEFLLLLPFLKTRFGGPPVGWLHPLILPTALTIVFGFIRDPAYLLHPILVWTSSSAFKDHVLIGAWDEVSQIQAQLNASIIIFLSVIATYIGFMLMGPLRRSKEINPTHLSGLALIVFFAISMLTVVFFLEMQGGILAHMSTFAGGRFGMREANGHFLVVSSFLPYAALLWYASRSSALINPIFLAGIAISTIIQFILTGSRSSLFTPMALLLTVWMFHKQQVPTTRAVMLGFLAVLLLGVLGEVRRSGQGGSVDFTALTNFSIQEAWEKSQQELFMREIGSDMAVAALVPDPHNYLYGTTYIAALTFWLPRSIWPDKPRGAGAHAAAILYGDRSTASDYTGASYPISGAFEAYWNFSYPGVFMSFTLFGAALSVVCRWFFRNPRNPYALITLLILSFNLRTPSTESIVPTLQILVMLYVLNLFVSRRELKR